MQIGGGYPRLFMVEKRDGALESVDVVVLLGSFPFGCFWIARFGAEAMGLPARCYRDLREKHDIAQAALTDTNST